MMSNVKSFTFEISYVGNFQFRLDDKTRFSFLLFIFLTFFIISILRHPNFFLCREMIWQKLNREERSRYFHMYSAVQFEIRSLQLHKLYDISYNLCNII